MDERNTNEQNPQTTPYQTPVRGSSEAGSSYYHTADNGNANGDQGQYTQNTQQYSQYSQNTQNTQNGYSWNQNPNQGAYQQWSGNTPPKKPKKPKREKKPRNWKFPWKAAIAVILVGAVAFGGGTAVGRMTRGNDNTSAPQQEQPATDKQTSGSASMQISAAAEDAASYNNVYEKVSPSIVAVVVNYVREGATGSGSGVIMSEDGYIITNNHVVEDGDQFQVILNDSTTYGAELIGRDEQTDLAVLKIEAEDLVVAEFGEADAVKVGDRAFAIGSPGGVEFQNSFTGGYISALNRNVTINDRVMSLIQTDTAINPGNSGGALINTSGQVIGITSSKLSGSSNSASIEGMGFAIPTDTTKEVVDQLIANGHVVGRPAIGISGYDIDEARAKYFNIPQGVMITEIDAASDAKNQNIKTGDIIVGINGKEITGMAEINAVKNELKAGDTITLKLYRSGKTFEVTVTLIDQTELQGTDTEEQNTESEQDGYSYGYGWNPFGGYGYSFP